MQRELGGGRALRGLGENSDGSDSERAVFYDLDAGSRRSAIQQQQQQQQASALAQSKSTTAARAKLNNTKAAATGNAHKRVTVSASAMLRRPNEIFHHASLLQLDASDGDSLGSDDGGDNENPFASLLQPRTQHAQHSQRGLSNDDDEAARLDFDEPAISSSGSQLSQQVSRQLTFTKRASPPRAVVPCNDSSSSAFASNATRLDRSSRNSSQRAPATSRSTRTATARSARASVEAADARPSRWAQRTTGTIKKPAPRRKSVTNPLQRERGARIGQSEPRRTSLPMASSSLLDSQPSTTLDDGASPHAPKRRRLADVLLRATLLSQQKTLDDRQATQPQGAADATVTVEKDDAIADTARELQNEPFEMQFFSPSKLTNSAAARRRLKPEAAVVASKIRGALGDAIAKALRKTTRDLTLLHSHGQTLLEQQHSVALPGLGRVQDRESVVVRLQRQRHHTQDIGDRTVFNGVVHSLSAGLDVTTCPVKTRVRIAFSQQTATQLQLTPHALVRIYAPFHFLPLEHAPGRATRRATPQWLLLGTTLAEMVA